MTLGYGVAWDPETFASLTSALDDAKARAADPESDTPGFAEWCGWTVSPTGARLGGAGGPVARYRIERHGFVFLVMARSAPSGETPNVYATASAVACLQHGGLEGAAIEARAMLADLGGSPSFELLSRVDIFADLEGLDVACFNRGAADDRLIGRWRKLAVYWDGRRATGVSAGSGPLVCRCYDKAHEIQNNPTKAAEWARVEWGGKPPETCTRVEYQLRRQVLRQLNVGTVAEFVERRAAVAAYLLDWFRLAGSEVDRDHADRAPDAEEWTAVREAFARSKPLPEPAERGLRPGAVNCDHLRAVAVGCLAKIGGYRRWLPEDFDTLLAHCFAELGEHRDRLRTTVPELLKRARDDVQRRAASLNFSQLPDGSYA